MKSKIFKVRYSNHGEPGRPLRPKIQMEGKWLEEIGFDIGARIVVEYENGAIHIRPCTDQENAVEDEIDVYNQMKKYRKEADHLHLMVAETRHTAKGNY